MESVEFSKPRPLCDSDSINGFSCGVEKIDAWLHRFGRNAQRRGTAVVYATFHDEKLAAFYTLSAQSIAREEASGWLARTTPPQIPVILLGMLGVDVRFQGQGLGHDMLLDAAQRSRNVAESIGAKALVVEPYDEKALNFYRKYGFNEIPGAQLMYAKLTK